MIRKKIPITPKNFQITNEQRATAVWLIKKYTSYSWIKRTKEALELFTNGYEAYLTKRGGSQWWRDNLQGLRISLNGYAKALDQFERGNLSKAQAFVYQGFHFLDWLEDPRTEITEKHVEIGYREPPKKAVGLYSYGSLALHMAFKTRNSFSGTCVFPRILDEANLPSDIADRLDPLAPISVNLVDIGQEFHTTGIWLPVSHPLGCPVYAEAGSENGTIEVPDMKFARWPSEVEFKNGFPPVEVEFLHGEVQSKFVLLWKEDRYERGKIPDESEYLDPTVELPTEPPIAKPVTDEDYF